MIPWRPAELFTETLDKWYVCYDKPIEKGLINILFLIKGKQGEPQVSFSWEYYGNNGLVTLMAEDETKNFSRTGKGRFEGILDIAKVRCWS